MPMIECTLNYRNNRTSSIIVYGDPAYQMCRYAMAPYKGKQQNPGEIANIFVDEKYLLNATCLLLCDSCWF